MKRTRGVAVAAAVLAGLTAVVPLTAAPIAVAAGGVSADGARAVTVPVTTTSAPPGLPALNRTTGRLIDHALCARPAGR